MGRVTEYIAFMNDKEKRKGKGMGKLKQSDLNNFKHLTINNNHRIDKYEFWHFAKDTKEQKTNKKG